MSDKYQLSRFEMGDTMSICYVCGNILNEKNQTEEHIFLNAIGGNLKSRNLICRECNSSFGNDIDSALAGQFNFIANMFNIKRDRGLPQPFDAIDSKDGNIYSIEPGGKPKIKKPIIQKNGQTYEITTASKKQARDFLNGLKRKNPELDVEAILNSATATMHYLTNNLEYKIHVGGSETFRSLCKTAVNFYLYKGGLRKNICHLIPYIREGDESAPAVRYLYSKNIQIPTKQDEVLHSIIIRGDATEKILFAYISLFDFYKVVVMLNDNYEDAPVEYSYFFDVLTHSEVSRDYTLFFTQKDFQNLIKRDISYTDKILFSLKTVIQKAVSKQTYEHIHELLTYAIDKAIKKFDNQDLSREEIINILTQEIMNQMTPWLVQRLKMKDSAHNGQ